MGTEKQLPPLTPQVTLAEEKEAVKRPIEPVSSTRPVFPTTVEVVRAMLAWGCAAPKYATWPSAVILLELTTIVFAFEESA